MSVQKFIEQIWKKHKNLVIIGFVLFVALVIFLIVYFTLPKQSSSSNDTGNLSKVFNTIGAKQNIEGYQDSEYKLIQDIAGQIVNGDLSLCYDNPTTDVEKNMNVSQIAKQSISIGLKNKDYINVAAVSILYLDMMTDLDPSDFTITKNANGNIISIEMKNPDNPSTNLKVSEFMNLMLLDVNNPNKPTKSPTDDDDVNDIDSLLSQTKTDISTDLESNKLNVETKIPIQLFAKIISLSITGSLHRGKCSLERNKSYVSINGKRKQDKIPYPTSLPSLRYKESKREAQKKTQKKT